VGEGDRDGDGDEKAAAVVGSKGEE
jgi:hypothetical protein